MLRYPAPLERVIEELERLPGIGPKSAQRLAFFLLARPREQAQGLAEAVAGLHEGIVACAECGNYAAARLCPVCADETRDRRVLCVVETATDLMALERAGEYRGLYHVLGGALSPLAGKGLDLQRLFRIAPGPCDFHGTPLQPGMKFSLGASQDLPRRLE